MSNDVKNLIAAKVNSAAVAYQSFVLLTSTGPNSLYCFFENKDAPYYHLRIKSGFNNEFHYIKCGNKSTVRKAFELIGQHDEYKKYKKAYFIDRDFDETIKDKFREIYETPCYSIENLYCSEKSIEELIKTDFQISADMPEYSKILNLYRKLREDFLEASLLFNAWYKLQKEKSEPNKGLSTVSLTDSLIPQWITLSLKEVTSNYDLEKIVAKYPSAIPVSDDELKIKMAELKEADLGLILRGKYIFNFMTSFIRLLLLDGTEKGEKAILTKPIKYNMDNSMALTLLTTYATTPTCLVEFIKQYN